MDDPLALDPETMRATGYVVTLTGKVLEISRR